MPPPTNTTAPATKDALVTGLRAWPALDGVQVERRWPGPSAEPEGVYLGNVSGESRIPNIKAGRQDRHETYQVEIVIWVYRASFTAEDAAASEDRAYELYAAVDEFVAENVHLLGHAQVNQVATFEEVTEPFEGGWATQITVTVAVSDRLL